MVRDAEWEEILGREERHLKIDMKGRVVHNSRCIANILQPPRVGGITTVVRNRVIRLQLLEPPANAWGVGRRRGRRARRSRR